MKKLIGSYKGEDIYIFKIHIDGAYDDSACGGPVANRDIIERIIPEACKIYFGDYVPLHIAAKEKLNLEEELPDDIVYACIGTCCQLCGDHLIMAWLQESDMDPYVEAQKHFKEVDWEGESRECCF